MSFENICFQCFKVFEQKLKCCSRCKIVCYCSTDCQEKNWRIHSSNCPRKDFLFKTLNITKSSMQENILHYMKKFDKENPEKIWKTLIYVCSEPFCQRNIYNQKTDTWIDMYPNAKEYFRNKILTLIKNYVKNKGRINFVDVEKKLRKESKLYFVEESIFTQKNEFKLCQQFFLGKKPYFKRTRKISRFQVGYFFSVYQKNSCTRKLFLIDVKAGDPIILNSCFPIFLTAALPNKLSMTYGKLVDAFEYDECDYVLDVIVDISPQYYKDCLPFKTPEVNMEKLKDAGLLTTSCQ